MRHKWPKIGVPARFDYPNPDRSKILGNKTYAAVEQDQLDYIIRAGATPAMIPPLPADQLQAFMAELDGLILQGGSDVSPGTYNAEPILDGRWPGDPRRDQFEMEIIALAMESDMSILGICRGFQILNCYFGGTLYQDLLTQRSESMPHRDIELYDQFFHDIDLKADGLFHQIFDQRAVIQVNSIHHQGIQKLGKGLIAEAFCKADGLIEAYSHEKYSGKIMGVQWHPEFCRKGDQLQKDAENFLGFWLDNYVRG